MPTGHAEHALLFLLAAYEPVGHGEQVELPALAKVPSWQSEQMLFPKPAADVPAPHTVGRAGQQMRRLARAFGVRSLVFGSVPVQGPPLGPA